MTPSTATLVVGYLLAAPFTAFVPGLVWLWRRRDPRVYACAQLGALLVAIGWAAKGNVLSAALNVAWLVGFGTAYAIEGRKRAAA